MIFQLNLINKAQTGDLGTYVLNGEWELLGRWLDIDWFEVSSLVWSFLRLAVVITLTSIVFDTLYYCYYYYYYIAIYCK